LSQTNLRVKICGITQAEQGKAIASLGATALGFICVPSSARYLPPEKICQITAQLTAPIDRIGVFANATLEEIMQTVAIANLTGVQLHGNESSEFCCHLRQALPQIELIKALRIRDRESLGQVKIYETLVDTLLLDAYHPQHLGGTGHIIDWQLLQSFQPACPWFLAGGLTPVNIQQALRQVNPSGIDLSSGVERSPGDKDLDKVAALFEQLSFVNVRLVG
jgi:phosphoribosylanthranilate isomerase